ncbi:MAG: tRNA (N(6)-L-threonylcarbamoyladenosine(37)-C(2))-methylthiotransferase MtaB [Sphingomonadales bacterium]
MSGPDVVTFGCRLNAYESQAIADALAPEGHADTVVFNTCAVTAEAVRQARQAIRKARRQRPDARIVVTGCAAQTAPQAFAAMREVDRVIGNGDKFNPRLYAFGPDAPPRVVVNDIMAVRQTAGHLVQGFADRARVFVEVQNGCDHRCTFCIIPYGRGPSRSVPAGAVVDQIRQLVDQGYREVVLTGVDLTSYGHDLPGQPNLGDLVRRILKLAPDLPRLRLSSIDQVEVDDGLFEVLAHEPRLMPHLHLSLQAGDDMILKRMKRRHSRAQAVEFCSRLKLARPGMAFGADLIAGFPTETEAMFANSLKLVEDCGLVYLHVFPFSARTGTPAAKMPQLPMAIRKARAARLRAAGAAAQQRFLQGLIGDLVDVLVERTDGAGVFGHSAQFAPVRLAAQAAPGTLLRGRVTGLDEEGRLLAVAA